MIPITYVHDHCEKAQYAITKQLCCLIIKKGHYRKYGFSNKNVLGNICRSPIAEGVFQKVVNDMNLGDKWEIDSAAIGGWHVGNPPDWRALDTMKKHNIPYDNHARQITAEDFNHYDFIFGMDEANMKDLEKRASKGSKAKLLLFGDFDPKGERIIRDPYYDSDAKGFEKCYEQSLRCAKGFLEYLDEGNQK